MRRALIFAAVLLPAGIVCAKARDTGYTLKVVQVDRAAGHVEAKFVVMPEDLRVVCEGDVKKVFEGDYVKVEIRDGEFALAGGKVKCGQIKWFH